MKVLLLALPFRHPPLFEGDSQLAEFRSRERLWSSPHLGLLTLAGLLPADWSLTYIDAGMETVADDDYEYVMLSPSTAQAEEAYAYARRFRRNGARILLGGPHVTMCPQEAQRYADVVFLGESEELLPAFLADERRGSARKVYRAQRRPSMTLTPAPRYDLAQKYPYKSIPVQLSRGCPHQCRFCLSSTIYGKAIRCKTREQIQAEIAVIRSLWKRPYLFFTDDNFFVQRAHSDMVLDILQENPVDWYAFTDVSLYQKEALLDRLPSTGCRKLLIGFESLDDGSLRRINASGFKQKRRRLYREAVETIQRRGIGVVGSFVLGLEEDTAETFERLYEFIYDTCLYGTNITVSTPFPGTALYRDAAERGIVYPDDWSLYDGFTLLRPLPHLSVEEFERLYRALLMRMNSAERIGRVLRYFQDIAHAAR